MAIALLLVSPAAHAYKRAEVDGVPGRFLNWASRTIGYAINRDGCKDVLINETVGAVQRSFFTWASPSCNDLYFIYDGLVSGQSTNLTLGENESPDRVNLLIWRTSWPPPGVTDGSITKDMPAVTTLIYNTDTGVIIDADIDFNAENFFWTASDDKTKVATDVQNTVTHEVGHLLGLAHSEQPSSTMFDTTHQGELDKRTLHPDDELGVCTIYPYGKTSPKGSGQGQVPQDVQGGCSLARRGAARTPCWLLLLGVVLLYARRLTGPRRPIGKVH